jgi:hypothetical protein
MREIRTSGLMSGEGKRGDWQSLQPPRPSSTLQPVSWGWGKICVAAKSDGDISEKILSKRGNFFSEGGFCAAKKLRLRVQVHELAAWMKYEPTGAKGPCALTALSVTSGIANAGCHAASD